LQQEAYGRNLEGDDRFRDYYGTVQSIATSSAQNDSGMFETNLRDERFLPFEGAGAVSTWTLTLSGARQFDYDTISDVVLHMNYTARQGGQLLGTKAIEAMDEKLGDENSPVLARIFSLKHDFPNAWHHFVNSEDDLKVLLKKEHFPYFVFVQKRALNVKVMKLVAAKDLTSDTLADSLSANVNEALADYGEYELTLGTSESAVLTKVKNADLFDAEVFLVVQYFVEKGE
jgi:hypothetical protein